MKTNILDYLDQGGLKSAPDSVWIKDGELSWTFNEFGDKINKIGTSLLNTGIKIGDVVLVFIPNSAHVLATDFGIVRSGAAFLNVDISLPIARIRAIIESTNPRLIVTNKAQHNKIPEEFLEKTRIYENLLETEIDVKALHTRRTKVIDTDPACLITTSGSTGTPKAVALSHRGIIDFGDWFDERFEFNQTDIVGSLSPLFFDGYIPGLLMSMLHGGKFVILPRESAAFPVKLVEHLADNNITFIFWVPSTLVPIAKLKILDGISLPKLKFIGFAGEVMPPSTLTYLRNALPSSQFVNFYGPIEISVICTYFEVPKDYPTDKPIPIGYPCANTRILILDDDNNLCAPRQTGELCVTGSCVALGYWNNPQKTAEAFVINPLVNSHSETIYRTGDLAILEEDGSITFVGRKDFQIKHQGYRIDLGEIEHAADVELSVKSCCVIYDKQERNIVLFYESTDELLAQEIRKRMGVRLPKYMLPTKIIRLESLPLNPNGKIDRKLLEINLKNY